MLTASIFSIFCVPIVFFIPLLCSIHSRIEAVCPHCVTAALSCFTHTPCSHRAGRALGATPSTNTSPCSAVSVNRARLLRCVCAVIMVYCCYILHYDVEYMCTLLAGYRIVVIFADIFSRISTSAKMFLHSALGRHAESVELWSALDLSLASTDLPTRLQFALALFRAGNYTESLQGNHTLSV